MTRTRSVRFLLHLEALEARDVPSFLPPVSYQVADAYDVTIADVNGDGRLDVVAVDNPAYNVAVLLGNGDGTLQPAAFYPAGGNPTGVAVADLNGDGKPDVVTANYNEAPHVVSVLLNNGNGTFGPPQGYGGADLGHKVAIGDVDGDHIPDVAVDSLAYEDVWVFHGNGDGTLASPPKVYEMPYWWSLSVQIADLDGDGVGDITVNQPDENLTVIYSGGAVVSYPKAYSASTHTVGDVNRDGWPDVIVGGNTNTVGVMLNRGDGTLLPSKYYGSGGHLSPMMADFNRDRKPDIAASDNYGSNSIGVILGNGDGTFKHPSIYPAGLKPYYQAAGDLNHDRYPDLVVVNYQNHSISVLLNDGNWAPPIPPPPGGRDDIRIHHAADIGPVIQPHTVARAEELADTPVKPVHAVTPVRLLRRMTTPDISTPFAELDA